MNSTMSSSSLRTSPRDCRSHRLRRRGHPALAAGLRPGGQYPDGAPQWPLCQRAYGAHAPGPGTGAEGAVSLPEDGQDLSAVVRSGSNLYQIDTRLLICTCADYQKHLQACKHLLATEVHTWAPWGWSHPRPQSHQPPPQRRSPRQRYPHREERRSHPSHPPPTGPPAKPQRPSTSSSRSGI